MEENKEQKIAQHKQFIETKARMYLKPLMIDILREKPSDVLDFMIAWCSGKGQEIRKEQNQHKNIPSSQKVEDVPLDYKNNIPVDQTENSKERNIVQLNEPQEFFRKNSQEQIKEKHSSEELPKAENLNEPNTTEEHHAFEVTKELDNAAHDVENIQERPIEHTKSKSKDNYDLPSSGEEEEENVEMAFPLRKKWVVRIGSRISWEEIMLRIFGNGNILFIYITNITITIIFRNTCFY